MSNPHHHDQYVPRVRLVRVNGTNGVYRRIDLVPRTTASSSTTAPRATTATDPPVDLTVSPPMDAISLSPTPPSSPTPLLPRSPGNHSPPSTPDRPHFFLRLRSRSQPDLRPIPRHSPRSGPDSRPAPSSRPPPSPAPTIEPAKRRHLAPPATTAPQCPAFAAVRPTLTLTPEQRALLDSFRPHCSAFHPPVRTSHPPTTHAPHTAPSLPSRTRPLFPTSLPTHDSPAPLPPPRPPSPALTYLASSNGPPSSLRSLDILTALGRRPLRLSPPPLPTHSPPPLPPLPTFPSQLLPNPEPIRPPPFPSAPRSRQPLPSQLTPLAPPFRPQRLPPPFPPRPAPRNPFPNLRAASPPPDNFPNLPRFPLPRPDFSRLDPPAQPPPRLIPHPPPDTSILLHCRRIPDPKVLVATTTPALFPPNSPHLFRDIQLNLDVFPLLTTTECSTLADTFARLYKFKLLWAQGPWSPNFHLLNAVLSSLNGCSSLTHVHLILSSFSLLHPDPPISPP